MKTITNIIVVALLFASYCNCAIAEVRPMRFFSRINSIDYIVDVDSDRLKKSPEWEAGKIHPPLSAREAFDSAVRHGLSIEKIADIKMWDVHSIALVYSKGDSRWFYCVRFIRETEDNIDSLQIVVLMNGESLRLAKRSDK